MNEDVLNQLRDIHMPTPPSVWPFAIGYYVIILLFCIAAVSVIYYYFIGRKSRRLKKEIWQELNAIESRFIADHDNAALQSSATALLKRLVFFRNRRELNRASELDDFAGALVDILPNRAKTHELIELLKKDRFSKNPKVDGRLLLTLLREQVRRCRI